MKTRTKIDIDFEIKKELNKPGNEQLLALLQWEPKVPMNILEKHLDCTRLINANTQLRDLLHERREAPANEPLLESLGYALIGVTLLLVFTQIVGYIIMWTTK